MFLQSFRLFLQNEIPLSFGKLEKLFAANQCFFLGLPHKSCQSVQNTPQMNRYDYLSENSWVHLHDGAPRGL